VVAPDPGPRLFLGHGHGPKQVTTIEREPFRHLREEPNIALLVLEELLVIGRPATSEVPCADFHSRILPPSEAERDDIVSQ
jgi:hypothetical protein